MKIKKEAKILITLVLAALVITVLLFFILFYKATLVISPDPKEAKITINGLPYPAGKIGLRPGTYKVAVSHPDFVGFEQTLRLKNGEQLNLDIKLSLLPEPKKVFEKKIRNLSQDPEGNLFFLAEDGAIYRGLFSDKKIDFLPITESNLGDVKDLIFSPNHNLAILKRGSTTLTTGDSETGLFDFKRYNLIEQEYRSFGKEIKGIAWQNSGEKIFYYFTPASGEKSLIAASPDNSNLERVADLRNFNFQDPAIQHSPTEDKIILIQDDVYLFETVPRSLSKLTQTGKVKRAKFSPKGQKIVYEVSLPDPAAGTRPTLALMDKDGKNQKDLGIAITLNQFTFHPEEQLGIFAGPEGLFQINLQNLEKMPYSYKGDPEILKKAENLLLSKDKKRLYFTSDGLLYQLELRTKPN